MLKKNLFGDTEAYLIFDDTVINKKYGYNIELTRQQYSGNEQLDEPIPLYCRRASSICVPILFINYCVIKN